MEMTRIRISWRLRRFTVCLSGCTWWSFIYLDRVGEIDATIKRNQERLATIDELEYPFFEELILDGRAGVQAAISKRKRELQKMSGRKVRLEKMLAYEKRTLYSKDSTHCRSG